MNDFLKKLIEGIFPFLQWKKDLSVGKKIYLIFNSIGSIFAIVYLSIYFFSHTLYTYKISDQHIAVYANSTQIENHSFDELLGRVEDKLRKSPLYYQGYRVDIHIVDNEDLFLFLSFFRDIDAFNLVDRIFINLNTAQKNYLYDYLYEEMVHEIIHSFQYRKYGGVVWSKIAIPFWVREGYPVYYSRENLVSTTEEGRRILDKYFLYGMSNLPISDKYQISGMLVKHAIEKMHKSVDDLHLGKVDYDEVLDSLLQEYNITKR